MLSYKHKEYSYEDKKNILFLNVLAKCCSYMMMDYVNNTSKLSVFLLGAKLCSYRVIFQTAISMSTSRKLFFDNSMYIRLELKVLKLYIKSLDTINT